MKKLILLLLFIPLVSFGQSESLTDNKNNIEALSKLSYSLIEKIHNGLNDEDKDLQINKFHLISIDSEVKASSATDLMSETKVSKKNKLQIGKWISKSSPIVLFDMTHINKALSERDIKAVDGIIGADILKKGKAIIDYEKSKLYLKL